MFKNLTELEKENKYNELINYGKKIKNVSLKKACLNILTDFKKELFTHAAGHDAIENIKNYKTHQCFDGGLLDHTLNVTRNSYLIASTYEKEIDMDLVLFGAILHDIGKIKIFDSWKENGDIKSNLNYSYLLVDHIYLGENLVETYLNKENIEEKLKYQALHIIAAHMDTMEKHMAEAYIVSYADSIDATIENIISYPRNQINPLLNSFIYESVNKDK